MQNVEYIMLLSTKVGNYFDKLLYFLPNFIIFVAQSN